jgi:hypothetical protein
MVPIIPNIGPPRKFGDIPMHIALAEYDMTLND